MAIRSVITRGYGNGTFNGTITLVVPRGYAIGVAVIADPVKVGSMLSAKNVRRSMHRGR